MQETFPTTVRLQSVHTELLFSDSSQPVHQKIH